MRLRVNRIEVSLDYTADDLRRASARELGCAVDSIDSIEVVRRSVDARAGRKTPVFVLSVELVIAAESLPARTRADVQFLNDEEVASPKPRSRIGGNGTRPVVIGAGPAGLMAALTLAESGSPPLVC